MSVVEKKFDFTKPTDFKEASKINKALLKMNEKSSSSSDGEEKYRCKKTL